MLRHSLSEATLHLDRAIRSLSLAEGELQDWTPTNGEAVLFGVPEAAAYVGMQPTSWSNRYREGKAPAPAVRLRCGPIWTKAQLDRYKEQRAA